MKTIEEHVNPATGDAVYVITTDGDVEMHSFIELESGGLVCEFYIECWTQPYRLTFTAEQHEVHIRYCINQTFEHLNKRVELGEQGLFDIS